MRNLFVLGVLAVALFAPLASAASTTEVHGTLAAWVTPVVVVNAGDNVVFTSLDVPHIGVVDGLVPKDGAYGATTVYEDVPKGTYEFTCSLHGWMDGVLVVQ